MSLLIRNVEVDFDFINDDLTKQCVINAFRAISECKLWEYMKRDMKSYTFCCDPEVYTIRAKMEELGYENHNPTSFGITMRHMQCIARHGLATFKERYLQAISSKA